MDIGMLFLLALAVAVVVTALAHEIRLDGYGHRPPPRSHADQEDTRELKLRRVSR